MRGIRGKISKLYAGNFKRGRKYKLKEARIL